MYMTNFDEIYFDVNQIKSLWRSGWFWKYICHRRKHLTWKTSGKRCKIRKKTQSSIYFQQPREASTGLSLSSCNNAGGRRKWIGVRTKILHWIHTYWNPNRQLPVLWNFPNFSHNSRKFHFNMPTITWTCVDSSTINFLPSCHDNERSSMI